MKQYGAEGMIAGLLGVAVAFLVFANTIPTVGIAQAAVGTNATGVAGNSNLTGAALPLTNLMLLLYVAIGIAAFATVVGMV